MTEKHKDYFHALTRRTWATWLGAGLVAAGLNLVLFLSMPHLVDPTPAPSTIDTLVAQVNVIRMKRPDTDVRRKPPEPPPKPPEPEPVPKKTDTTPRRPVRAKLTLPFEVNPRLPGGPDSLVLPPLESAPMVDRGALEGTFTTSQLDGPLTTLTRIPPVYPVRARRRGIQGWVKVAFVVDENGRVGDVSIIEADPEGLFERSVERCVRGWRFKPGTVEGMPVKAKVETIIRFELES